MRNKLTMRTKAKKAGHRAKIAEMRLAYFTLSEIAAKLKISVPTVKREIKSLTEEWRKEASEDIASMREREVQSLEVMEQKALAEWERSRSDYSKEVTERMNLPGKASDGGDLRTDPTVTKRETGGRLGDPRLFQVVLNIKERRAKLLGLDMPTKVAPTDPTGDKPYKAMDAGELAARIAELQAKAAAKSKPTE